MTTRLQRMAGVPVLRVSTFGDPSPHRGSWTHPMGLGPLEGCVFHLELFMVDRVTRWGSWQVYMFAGRSRDAADLSVMDDAKVRAQWRYSVEDRVLWGDMGVAGRRHVLARCLGGS